MLSLVVACVLLTHHEYGGTGSGMQDTTVEPSGGVSGLIQRNTDEGTCLHKNPSEMLTKAAMLFLLYPAVGQLLYCLG